MSRYHCAFFAGRAIYQSLQFGQISISLTQNGRAYALVVDDFNDSSKFTGVRAASKKDDSPDFYELPPCRFDVDSGHCESWLYDERQLLFRDSVTC